MDRINKFLEARPQKGVKTLNYKGQKFTVTKEDLKRVRAYKSSKCLDPAIKTVPNRIISNETLEPMKERPKRDLSEHFNRRLRAHFARNPRTATVRASKNEIVDIWADEDTASLAAYAQEWIYSIKTPYEGSVEALSFTKESLEDELKRVYMKHFVPRDPRQRALRDILPKLPSADTLRPFPEASASVWELPGRKFLFETLVCAVTGKSVTLLDMKYNKTIFQHEFDEEIERAALTSDCLAVSSTTNIHLIKYRELHREAANAIRTVKVKSGIKELYADSEFFGYTTQKSVYLHDMKTLEEVRILKLKGDTPHAIRVERDAVYASTHKGIMVDSAERSEIKNLGYVIDFDMCHGRIFALNNVGRLLVIDETLTVVSNAVQGDIGSHIRVHPVYDLVAVLFAQEISIYKLLGDQCVPVSVIQGAFRTINWDREMPWLYAASKEQIELFT